MLLCVLYAAEHTLTRLPGHQERYSSLHQVIPEPLSSRILPEVIQIFKKLQNSELEGQKNKKSRKLPMSCYNGLENNTEKGGILLSAKAKLYLSRERWQIG